jgi:hypothetical protein
MRKFVVALIVTLALFTFIRDYPSTQKNGTASRAEIHSALIP